MFQMPNSNVLAWQGHRPKLAEGVFIASGAAVIGQVDLGEGVSVWFNSVIRGDVNTIKIGARTNIQDNSTVHVTSKSGPTSIGCDVTIGHNVIIHACTIEDKCLIGMGSILLDGAVIRSGCMVAAGSVVAPGKEMPSGMLCMGAPAKAVRPLTEEELRFFEASAQDYVRTALSYTAKSLDF
jgi:carbonic anhydrase/acetyltransferase-like protein (isoleucine patch superfamily)